MRVLVTAYSYHSVGKSEGLVAFRLIEALRELGHTMTVLTRNARPEDAAISLGSSRLLGSRAGMGKAHKLDYYSFIRRCKRYAVERKAEFDLVHHVSPISLRYSNPLAGIGKPFIWGPIGGSISLPEGFPSIARREGMQALRSLDRWRLEFDPLLLRTQRLAARIVLTSSAARALIPDRFREKCVVIPEGIDESDFLCEEQPEQNYIMSSGRLIPYKGFDLLIRAFAASSRAHDAELWITGDGPDKGYLKGLVESSGLSDRIRMLGRVDRRQNLRLMKGSLFCVFPALKEAFGGVNLEAMAAGRAVIVTDWGGPADLVTEGVNGFKIQPSGEDRFIEAMAQRIRQLVADPAARSRMGGQARAVAHAHLWRELAPRYDDLYREAAKG